MSSHRSIPPILSSDSLASSLNRVTSLSPSRISVSLRPILRRHDLNAELAEKAPLLSLTLSSGSFIDCTVYDDVPRLPLYKIVSKEASTAVYRTDSWQGELKTAEIKWPRVAPSKVKGRDADGILVQMKGGRWKTGSTFLRAGTLPSSPRKFNIPGYSKSLKWKQVGNSYWCITASVSGPIAVLEPGTDAAHPSLSVFETLHDKYDAHPMLVHRGVSILLLDYLLVTSLLLLTDAQEWMRVSGDDTSPPTTAASPSQPHWKKFIFGQPLFPRRASSPAITSSLSEETGLYSSPTLVSSFIDIRAGEPDTTGQESDIEEPDQTPTRPTSPSSKSVTTNPNAPSHSYLDPMFYTSSDAPPVPPLPEKYLGAVRLSTPNSPSSTSPRRTMRTLPQTPPTRARSMSTPSQEVPPQIRSNDIVSSDSVARPRPVRPVVRTQSIGSRRLPVPPTPTTPSSSATPIQTSFREKRSSAYGRRSLPPTPISAPVLTFPHGDRLTQTTTKDSHDELLEWTGGLQDGHTRQPTVEIPPPAYNTINFSKRQKPTLTDEQTAVPAPPQSTAVV